MCEPVSAGTALAVSAGMTIASQGAQYLSQAQQANEAAAYQDRLTTARNQQIVDNARIAAEAQQTQIDQLNRQDAEAAEGTHRDLMDARSRSLQTQAAARVAAGEAGVSGLSVDALLSDYARSEAVYRDVTMFNRTGQRLNDAATRKAIGAQTEGRIQSIQPYIPQPVAQPDFFGAMLRIGAQGAQDYFTYFPPE